MTTGTTLHAVTALFKARTAFGHKDFQTWCVSTLSFGELPDSAIYCLRLPGYRCRNSVATRR